ncbi:MAG: ribonuclease P protein component [Prevotella sp.]|nr:ribonuclease P protein component [Prevotella sp.]MCF0208462.1 ribonuclease P protein component [Bacteroidaceae bacterium]
MEHTFPKSERIYLQKEVEELFAPGNAKGITNYPIRMVYRYVTRENEQEPRVKVLISVSKKRLRRAVDRVRAKRQMREAYRLNKPSGERAANIAFIWLADKPQESSLIHAKMIELLQRL